MIYYLNVNTVSRGNSEDGASDRGSDYINRDGRYGESKQEIDYINRDGRHEEDSREVLFKHSGNMPIWAQNNPSIYWKNCDLYERSNGRLFKPIKLAIPEALPFEIQKKLIIEFSYHLTSKHCLPFSAAIHRGKENNPHAHLMISERMNDGRPRNPEIWFKRHNGPLSGGAKKTDALKPQSWLIKARKDWADYANRELEKIDSSNRIDHRTLKEQGILRIPQIHLGPRVVAMEEKGIRTTKGEIFLKINEINNKIIERQRDGASDDEIKNIIDKFEKEMRKEYGNFRKDRGSTKYQGKTGNSRGFGGFYRDKDRGNDEHVGSWTEGFSRDGLENKNSNESAAGNNTTNRRYNKNNRQNQDNERNGNHFAGTTIDIDSYEQGDKKSKIAIDQNTDDSHYNSVVKRTVAQGDRAIEQSSQNDRDEAHKNVTDKTYQAVVRQMRAMGLKRFDVGILDQKNKTMVNRTWTREEIMKAIPWLKRENAQGANIYIRPVKGTVHNLVLIDDIDGLTIEQMKEDGYAPALTVETSDKNFQAWIKLSKPATGEEIKAIARFLAKKYEADIGSADANHYSRLAGFSNRKEQHENRYGQYPYVLLRNSNGRIAVRSKELIKEARGRIEREKAGIIRMKRNHDNMVGLKVNTRRLRPHNDFYKSELKGFERFKNRSLSRSQIDFTIARKMLLKGYTVEDVKDAMRENSEKAHEKRIKHGKKYIDKTIENILKLNDVNERVEAGRERE